MIYPALYPCGVFQGGAVLRLSGLHEGPEIERLALLHPGLIGIWLDTVEWGSPALDELVTWIASNPKTQHLDVLGVRPIGAEKWAHGVRYTADVSRLLVDGVTEATLREVVADLPFFPQLFEVVAIDPHPSALTPMVLDALADVLPWDAIGTLYVSDPHVLLNATQNSITRTRVPWVVRPLP